ncbi:hypothetical protein BAE44_0012598 [Dichanthelium oligosanthes]|uniref:BED-type domain-containing protein n=1 Tax=Dichanthelium oligosanthes TaxID=888268 RepID=A0A1E5VMM6_9POAL|nr:hypothetical protein BAE44_0012598 [Dichanthelium oligosanthes]
MSAALIKVLADTFIAAEIAAAARKQRQDECHQHELQAQRRQHEYQFSYILQQTGIPPPPLPSVSVPLAQQSSPMLPQGQPPVLLFRPVVSTGLQLLPPRPAYELTPPQDFSTTFATPGSALIGPFAQLGQPLSASASDSATVAASPSSVSRSLEMSYSQVTGMEGVDENANKGIDEQEESTDSNPSPLYSGTKLNKRLRSKVWDTFTPSFIDGKVALAECMHCHRVLKCTGTNGTGSLLRHQANCSTRTQKRPWKHEHTSLPDPKQKRLSFSPSSQKKCLDMTDASPEQRLALPGTRTDDSNMKNQETDQNGSHDEFVVPEQKNLASHSVSADKNMENQARGEVASSEQVNPTGTNWKNREEVKQNCSREEIVRVLSMHGYHPSMMELDRFKELVAYLNPMVKMPSFEELSVDFYKLFQEEESKLKEKLVALCSRVCLSVYVWHYNPRLAFLCLSVHYIDDEWEKQQKIIRFHAVGPSCNAKELSNIISMAIEQWRLGGKVFSIILDEFIDDTVASNVKASLQKCKKLAANRSLFVVRYSTHLLDQVIRVGLDELDTYMENYAPSNEDWKHGKKICKMLQDFHKHMDFMHNFPSPPNFFDKLWAVKKEVHLKADMYMQPYILSRKEEAFSKVREKMQRKFMECWNVCFMHFFMPMVMDPNYRLKHIMPHLDFNTFDDDKKDYLQQVHDTLASLFNEYSNLKEDPNGTSGATTSKETVVDGDMLMQYYLHSKYPYSARPLSEFDQYLHEPCLTTGESSVLQWWKEHHLTYPTIARMARDILALLCSTDCKEATRTARIAMSGARYWAEELVCVQDWLKPAGTTTVESMDDL